MPSGITAAIHDGTDTTLRGYLMTVGRGMGFAIMQRDDDHRAPVYERELRRARERLAELEQMTPRMARAATREAADEAHRRWVEERDRKLALRGRYEEMIRQVEAWEPEPLIAQETQTKEYALKYLRESLDFDCGKPGEEMRYYPEPHALSPDAWLRREIEQARAAIDRHEQSMREEVDRTAERNRFIDAFLASLPPEEVGERPASSSPSAGGEGDDELTIVLPRAEAEVLVRDAVVQQELAASALHRICDAILAPVSASPDGEGERGELRACAWCGHKHDPEDGRCDAPAHVGIGRCPCPGDTLPPSAGEGDTPARFRRLLDAMEAIELHGLDDRFPCYALCDADCIEVMRETARAARQAVAPPREGGDGDGDR